MPDFLFKLSPVEQVAFEFDENQPGVFQLAPVDPVGLAFDGNADDTVIFKLQAALRGEQGIQGDAGPGAGPVQSLIAVAGESLGGHRVVGIAHDGTYTYVDQTVHVDGFRAAGITTGAAALGAAVTIQTRGTLTEPSWNWTVDLPVFVGSNGVPTQTVPTLAGGALFSQMVGLALTATSIFVQMGVPIYL